MPTFKTMRITGGTLVRRRFLLPAMVDEGTVRPTPDRVREAVFSMILQDMLGARVLDLFAGSGAHGYEAVSRGAQFVRFIEKDPRVFAVIKENVAQLGISDKCAVQLGDALKYVDGVPQELSDVIFVDPPYTIKPDRAFFMALEKHLSPQGVVIFRCFKKEHPDFGENFVVDRDRVYGGTRVFILRRAVK